MGSLLQNTVFGRTKNSFVSTWRTSNTSSGSSTSTQIKLPLISSGSYNFNVDWGDGNSDKITVWNQVHTTHTYSVAGDYIIKISGVCTGWQFNNTGDRLKILSVSSWGKFRLGNGTAYFYGCTNMSLASVSDILDLTGTKTFINAFRACGNLSTVNRMNEWDTSGITNMANAFYSSTFNQPIDNWNVSNVTDFSSMFQLTGFNQPLGSWNTGNATTFSSMFNSNNVFNQNIGSWNVSNVSSFYLMFNFCTAFNNGESNAINNWIFKTTGTVNFGNMFTACSKFNQPIGNWNTIAVTTMNDMFSNATIFNQDIGSWNTSNVTNMTNMFLLASAFNQNIGMWNVVNVTNFTSMFRIASAFNNGGSNAINNWVLNTTSSITMNDMFNQTNAFNQPLALWNVRNVTNMNGMFARSGFNQPIGNWNTANVTEMSLMFYYSAFNQNIGAWNVSNVTTFANMFLGASAFNNGGYNTINNWVLNTIGTINMTSMFQLATAFNQNIGSWNVSNVTTFASMFQSANAFNNGGSSTIDNWVLKTSGVIVTNMFNSALAFNQPVGNWNMIGVTSTFSMFQNAQSFNNGGNSNINNWNVSNVNTMQNMFYLCSVFNQNLGAWNVTKVTSFQSMLQDTPLFNNGGSSDINNWVINTTTNVTMFGMFRRAMAFNQPLNSWNVAFVNNMGQMFYQCITFNQPLYSWNTGNVINMNTMFYSIGYTTAFNQNIGMWNISNITDFLGFMQGKTVATFSTTNLDAIYNGWSSLLGKVKPSISIHFGSAKHTATGSAGKAILTASPNNWVIIDGGI